MPRRLLPLLLAACVAAGCGDGDDGVDARPTAGTSPDEYAGFPYQPDVRPPPGLSATELATWRRGLVTYMQSGCVACHRLAGGAPSGPGRDLTRIGARLSPERLRAVLVDPPAPMPSFGQLAAKDPRDFTALVVFLGSLR